MFLETSDVLANAGPVFIAGRQIEANTTPGKDENESDIQNRAMKDFVVSGNRRQIPTIYQHHFTGSTKDDDYPIRNSPQSSGQKESCYPKE
jgi:hypothetical protein